MATFALKTSPGTACTQEGPKSSDRSDNQGLLIAVVRVLDGLVTARQDFASISDLPRRQ